MLQYSTAEQFTIFFHQPRICQSASVGNFILSMLCCMTSALDLSLPITPVPPSSIPCRCGPGKTRSEVTIVKKKQRYKGTKGTKIHGYAGTKIQKAVNPLAQVRRKGVRGEEIPCFHHRLSLLLSPLGESQQRLHPQS